VDVNRAGVIRHDDALIRGDGDVVMDAAETPWFNLVVVEVPAKLLQILGDLTYFNRFDSHDLSQYTRKLPKTDSRLRESDTHSSAIFRTPLVICHIQNLSMIETVKHTLKMRGLSAVEVLERRRKFGTNIITPPDRDPWWKLFFEKFDDPVIRILMIAAVIAIGVGAMHGQYFEGIGIILAVLLATVLAFLNEFKASKSSTSLIRSMPARRSKDSGLWSLAPRTEALHGLLDQECGVRFSRS
jgi:Cation transporter/ATPase, N-terminus